MFKFLNIEKKISKALSCCCERAFGLRELLFSTQWAKFLRLLWFGQGTFSEMPGFQKKKKKTHSFSSNQGSVLKFENFAVIRRMNYFSVSLGFPLGAQAAECSPPMLPCRAPQRRWEPGGLPAWSWSLPHRTRHEHHSEAG